MDLETRAKLAIYRHFADTGDRPSLEAICSAVTADTDSVRDALAALRSSRVLVLESDGSSIRMAPPFSGVPTQHVVMSGGIRYYANCAWDALGVAAVLHRPAEVHSRCEQSGDALRLHVGADGPDTSSWVFHCLVPAAKWWENIVFT